MSDKGLDKLARAIDAIPEWSYFHSSRVVPSGLLLRGQRMFFRVRAEDGRVEFRAFDGNWRLSIFSFNDAIDRINSGRWTACTAADTNVNS